MTNITVEIDGDSYALSPALGFAAYQLADIHFTSILYLAGQYRATRAAMRAGDEVNLETFERNATAMSSHTVSFVNAYRVCEGECVATHELPHDTVQELFKRVQSIHLGNAGVEENDPLPETSEAS